jgi:2-dehydro-3-deoxygluconokinase
MIGTTNPLNAVKHLVFFGECMREHRANGSVHFGGDTFNAAWYCSLLLNQLGVTDIVISYATSVGQDTTSSEFLTLLSQNGIKQDYVTRHSTKTMGEYWVKNLSNGERQFSFSRSNSAAKDYFENDEPLSFALNAKHIDAIFLSGISLAILPPQSRTRFFECLNSFKQQGGLIFFDNNYRASLWPVSEANPAFKAMMALADIAFLTNDDEYAVFGKSTVDDIINCHHGSNSLTQSFAEMVIRQGAAPCVIKFPNSDALTRVTAAAVSPSRIVDTCAAGDAFAGAYLAARLCNNHGIVNCHKEAANLAHQVAATVIQQYGALLPAHAFLNCINKELS